MMTLTALTEVLRRREIGDPVSKISVDLKTPKSTVRGWLKFAQQHGLTFKKVAGMTLKQFKEIRAQSSQPCARMLQPDWDNVVAESRKPGMTLQALYEDYCRTSPTKPHMKRSSFYLKYKQVKETVDVSLDHPLLSSKMLRFFRRRRCGSANALSQWPRAVLK